MKIYAKEESKLVYKKTADEEKRQPLNDGKANNVIEKEVLGIICVCLPAEFPPFDIKTVSFRFAVMCKWPSFFYRPP